MTVTLRLFAMQFEQVHRETVLVDWSGRATWFVWESPASLASELKGVRLNGCLCSPQLRRRAIKAPNE